jgi:hypothetical protein
MSMVEDCIPQEELRLNLQGNKAIKIENSLLQTKLARIRSNSDDTMQERDHALHLVGHLRAV